MSHANWGEWEDDRLVTPGDHSVVMGVLGTYLMSVIAGQARTLMREDCEDILQNTYVGLYRWLSGKKGPKFCHVRRVACIIARREVVNWWRAWKRHRRDVTRVFGESGSFEAVAPPEQKRDWEVEAGELARMVDEAGLSELEREILLLNLFGVTSEAIGLQVGLSPLTVRQRASRAMKEIRTELERRQSASKSQ